MIAAGALIVIETVTSSSGMLSKSVSMSSTVSTATPSTPDLAKRAGVVGIEAHEARHVEGGREACLPVVEQVAKASVGLLYGPESGELAHRPQAPAVHGLVDAPCVRELPGLAEIAVRVPPGKVILGVEGLHRMPGHGVVEPLALRGIGAFRGHGRSVRRSGAKAGTWPWDALRGGIGGWIAR